MKKSALYTTTGDAGTTSLVGGKRVSKASARLESYGTVDELNSHVGLIVASAELPTDERQFLLRVQSKLFNLGAYLATESKPEAPATLYGLDDDDVAAIEQRIDALDEACPRVHAFVLPTGTALAAHVHIARTVARRAERCIVALAAEAPVEPLALRYINRLSDYLFILARFVNIDAQCDEIFWQKD